MIVKIVKEGEIITYQNDYLEKMGNTEKARVLMNLFKDTKLHAGANYDGKVAIESGDITDCDCLVVRLAK